MSNLFLGGPCVDDTDCIYTNQVCDATTSVCTCPDNHAPVTEEGTCVPLLGKLHFAIYAQHHVDGCGIEIVSQHPVDKALGLIYSHN